MFYRLEPKEPICQDEFDEGLLGWAQLMNMTYEQRRDVAERQRETNRMIYKGLTTKY